MQAIVNPARPRAGAPSREPVRDAGSPSAAAARRAVARIFPILAAAALSASSARALPQSDVLATVNGTVVDLSPDSSGRLLYCTREMDVGRVTTAGAVTVLATAVSGPFTYELRGVVEDPNGQDVTVVDKEGNLWRLVNGATPAVQAYADLYLIQEATDLMVDATGNYVIPCDTPSNGVRTIDWVDATGQRWAYYSRKDTPLQVAWDPVGARLVYADQGGGGALRGIDVSSQYVPVSPIETQVQPGFTESADDGDLAIEADGDILYIAGGTLRLWSRASGTTTTLASGFQQLRGLAIAASSGNVASASGWSAYVAETIGAMTTIHEVGDVDAPASVIADSLGTVPGKGTQRTFFGNIQTFELATDLNGDFLVGGWLFGSQPQIRRIDKNTFQNTLIADDTDGIAGRVEGITVTPDGSIYALTTTGIIQKITENPLTVTTIFSDPGGNITAGKDLLYGRNGKLWVADRDFFGGGEVVEVDLATGTAHTLATLVEARGLAAEPTTGTAFVSEWGGQGFNGSVDGLDLQSGAVSQLPGFSGMNYTNDSVWGDGDIAVDVYGSAYTISEDDWSLVRWDPAAQAFARVGSSYLRHPSGLVIAPSNLPSTTGWSLYVSEFDFLYEIPGVHAAAPTRVDPGAPGTGRAVGYLNPSLGAARAILPDPAGGAMLVSTAGADIVRMDDADGTTSVLADSTAGLSGDIVGLAQRQSGTVLAAASDGHVYQLDPANGYAVTTLFDDAADTLQNVRSISVDGSDRALLVDLPTGSEAGHLWRLETDGTLTLLSRPRGGLHPAVDPLTAEVWVTEEGNPADGFGEIQRVEALASPPTHGHWTPGVSERFVLGDEDGALAFLSDGSVLVGEGTSGRIWLVDRQTGARTMAAANYQRPVALALAPGTPGTAGSQGTSLFVLDDYVVWESGIEGLPAGPPPATNPGLDLPADLRITGELTLGSLVPIQATSAANAGKLYALLPTMSGKVPGLPLLLLGDPTDTRVVPSNPDLWWQFASSPAILPGFVSVLDPNGVSSPGAGFPVPNDASYLSLDFYLDVAWVVIDGTAQDKVAFVGGTTSLYVGD